jgi:hypothetical protein
MKTIKESAPEPWLGTVRIRDPITGTPVKVDIEVMINWHYLSDLLAQKAIGNASGRMQAFSGGIRAKLKNKRAAK